MYRLETKDTVCDDEHDVEVEWDDAYELAKILVARSKFRDDWMEYAVPATIENYSDSYDDLCDTPEKLEAIYGASPPNWHEYL